MRNSPNTQLTDLELCKIEINKLLREYNCSFISADEYSRVLIIDNDTNVTDCAEDRR